MNASTVVVMIWRERRPRRDAASGLRSANKNYFPTLTNFQPVPPTTLRELTGEGSKYSTTK